MSRTVDYTKKSYSDNKEMLVEFVRKYYPNEFSNFQDLSVEMIFTEMMAFLSDSLHFNIDDAYQNSFIQYTDNLSDGFRKAKSLGYKPKNNSLGFAVLRLSQIVPALEQDGEFVPDIDYAGIILSGTQVSGNNNIYELIENVDMRNFKEVEVEEVDNDENPTSFRIFNDGIIRSGQRKTKSITVSEFKSNLRLFLDENVAMIESITDSENNKWYEVEYMAQDTIFESELNNNDGELSEFSDFTPYMLRARRISRKFVVDYMSDGQCFLQFGQGNEQIKDEYDVVNFQDLVRKREVENISNSFIISNFFHENSFGVVPSNTSLNVTYLVSRGVEENAVSESIDRITRLNVTYPNNSNNEVRQSFECVNEKNLTGSKLLDSLNELKFNVPLFYSSQGRCVTLPDYLVRVKMMPPKFGSIDKAFVEKNVDYQLKKSQYPVRTDNKSLNIYVLSRNSNNNLVECNPATKQNLKTYIKQFKMAGDTINILDPFIINFKIFVDYYGRSGYSNDEIELNLGTIIRDYFNLNRWEINQPIVVEDLRRELLKYGGVLSVPHIEFENVYDENEGYSGVIYNMSTKDENYDAERGILYPPRDVSIFELKNPDQNIFLRHV